MHKSMVNIDPLTCMGRKKSVSRELSDVVVHHDLILACKEVDCLHVYFCSLFSFYHSMSFVAEKKYL